MPVITDGSVYFPVSTFSEEYETIVADVAGEEIAQTEAEWAETGFSVAGVGGEFTKANGEVVYFDAHADELGCTWFVGGEVRTVDYRKGYRR